LRGTIRHALLDANQKAMVPAFMIPQGSWMVGAVAA